MHLLVLLNLRPDRRLLRLIIPGVIWHGTILAKTGYRKIDLLLLLVPIAGPITGTRTQWRYCAKDRYWEPASVPAASIPVAA